MMELARFQVALVAGTSIEEVESMNGMRVIASLELMLRNVADGKIQVTRESSLET